VMKLSLYIIISLLMVPTSYAQQNIPDDLTSKQEIVLPDQKKIQKEQQWINEQLPTMNQINPNNLKGYNLGDQGAVSNHGTLNELLKQYKDHKPENKVLDKGVHLFVFVSASIPNGSMKRIADESKTHKATLVLNGMVNKNLNDTKSLVQGYGGHKWEINPKGYEHFNVTSVPTTVLYDGEDWVSVVGDVSISYSLEKFAQASDHWKNLVYEMRK